MESRNRQGIAAIDLYSLAPNENGSNLGYHGGYYRLAWHLFTPRTRFIVISSLAIVHPVCDLLIKFCILRKIKHGRLLISVLPRKDRRTGRIRRFTPEAHQAIAHLSSSEMTNTQTKSISGRLAVFSTKSCSERKHSSAISQCSRMPCLFD
jgi:hypothetical protein